MPHHAIRYVDTDWLSVGAFIMFGLICLTCGVFIGFCFTWLFIFGR